MLLAPQRKAREFTELQAKFLAALADPENRGDVRTCMNVAGYSKDTQTHAIVKQLKDEMLSIAQEILAGAAPKVAMSLTGLIDDPINPAANTIIRAAESIFDRVGIVKTERVEVEAKVHNIALMPSRKKPDEEEDR